MLANSSPPNGQNIPTLELPIIRLSHLKTKTADICPPFFFAAKFAANRDTTGTAPVSVFDYFKRVAVTTKASIGAWLAVA